jgi:hypothetical protein
MDYLHYDLGHQNAGAVVEVLSVAAIDQDREGETEQGGRVSANGC